MNTRADDRIVELCTSPDGDAAAPLVSKAPAERYERIEQASVNSHPYELPEIIAVPIERGFEQYLPWINEL